MNNLFKAEQFVQLKSGGQLMRVAGYVHSNDHPRVKCYLRCDDRSVTDVFDEDMLFEVRIPSKIKKPR